jgi:hypothetical protein
LFGALCNFLKEVPELFESVFWNPNRARLDSGLSSGWLV